MNINLKYHIVILIVFCLALVNCSNKQSSKEKNTNNNIEELKLVINAKIKEIVIATNAIDNWEYKLCYDDSSRWTDVLTKELEDVWISERPILFIGHLLDIKSTDKTHYIVIIEQNWRSESYSSILLWDNFELHLKSPKSIINQFLEQNTNILDNFTRDIAVIGKIDEILTEYYFDNEGTRQGIKIGLGNLVAIISLVNQNDPLGLF